MIQQRYLYLGGVRDGLFENFVGDPQYSRSVMAGTEEVVSSIEIIGRSYTSNIKHIEQVYRLVRERGALRVEDTDTYLMVLTKDPRQAE
jgi:hypothetical protein